VINVPRDRALLSTIYRYGLRVTEATLIKLSDVDFNRQTIFIPRLKGGCGGVKPLLSHTAELLKAYLAVREPTGDAFFTGRQGNLTRHRIHQIFKQYARKVEITEHSVHSLRHSIATHMLEGGFELEVVKNHLGHRNIQSTLIYAQLTDKRLLKVFRQMEQSRAIVKI